MTERVPTYKLIALFLSSPNLAVIQHNATKHTSGLLPGNACAPPLTNSELDALVQKEHSEWRAEEAEAPFSSFRSAK